MTLQTPARPDGREHEAYYSLEREWQELCAHYLPVAPEGVIWRYSRRVADADPEQGWKLHLPATVLTAGRLLAAVAPLLQRHNVAFKAPCTLLELDKLNSGVFYGYSQVGKCLTIYPRTTAEAVRLARRLHKLTRGWDVPAVPYDLQFRADSSVYYRYGAFKLLEIENADGTHTPALRTPWGALVPDLRDAQVAKPVWVRDLFSAQATGRETAAPETPLRTSYRVFAALSQRGKGGVYQAIDLTTKRPRLCVVKEGRHVGEVWWDGRDGYTRTQHEGRVLVALRAAGVNVPRVYSSFHAGQHYYLALEFIGGTNFERWLTSKKRRLSLRHALLYGRQLAELLAQIHASGWVWRDCKPANLILTKAGELRPLDFEGACPIDRPDPMPWSSTRYAPPECAAALHGRSRLPEDFYALGALLYLLLAGRAPVAQTYRPLTRLRRNVPAPVCALVNELLSTQPARRPDAAAAARRLSDALAALACRGVSTPPQAGVSSRLSQGVRPMRAARDLKRGSGRKSLKSGSTVKEISDEKRS